jgi:hypothetical protein
VTNEHRCAGVPFWECWGGTERRSDRFQLASACSTRYKNKSPEIHSGLLLYWTTPANSILITSAEPSSVTKGGPECPALHESASPEPHP